MGKAFDQLKVGDRIDIAGTVYEATGRMVLRTPDGSMWSEWLFVPSMADARTAIAEGKHRWLVFEPGAGLSLWSAAKQPAGFNRDAMLKRGSLEYQGRTFRLVERDSYRVDDILGNVGGDVAKNQSFEFADLRSGMESMTLEWNEQGLDLTHGKTITPYDLLQWSRKAGTDLNARLPATTATRTTRAASLRPTYDLSPRPAADENSLAGNIFGWLLAIVVFVPIVMLEECSDSDDCYTRTDPATGKVETVCNDGVRSRGGRSFGGWGGK